MNIFLARNNVQAGPYTLEQLNHMFETGQIELTDLMWHEGMANWQRVGEVTGGQFYYRPTFSVNSTTHAVTEEEDYIINNTPSQNNPTNNSQTDNSNIWDKYSSNNPHNTNGKSISLTKTSSGFDVSHAKKQLDLASVGSRILAKLIDYALMIMSCLPLIFALINSPNFAKIKQWAEAGQIMLTTEQQQLLLNAVPMHIMLLSNILFWGLVFAQMFLLIRRGQTIGKMALGIRILDRQSNAIPNFFNLIIMRSLLTSVVYSISIIGLVALVVDFVFMLTNPDRQSLHDKIAKTYVVRADDTQTTPLELKPE